MSRLFDDKIRERLANYSQQPPEMAKKAILSQVSSPSKGLFYFYQTVSALLLLVALFEIGSSSDNYEEKRGENPVSSVKTKDDVQVTRVKEFALSDDDRTGGDMVTQPEIFSNPAAKKGGHVFLAKQEKDQNRDLSLSEIDRLDKIGFTVFEPADPSEKVPVAFKRGEKSIIPKKTAWASTYFNGGAFFIYNRFRPNLDDDIYVGEYSAPFSISGSRVGLVVEAGIHRQWTDRFASRVGLSINNYSQSYSFTVRNARPDSFSVNVEENFLEPNFDTENVQISERVTLVGVKAQGFWYLFQNTSNVLFTALEYQRLIGKGPQFQYQDQTYYLMKPSQCLVEIGLRKNLYEFKSGNLYAMPGIRYSLSRFTEQGIIGVKPFSVGITISYGLK